MLTMFFTILTMFTMLTMRTRLATSLSARVLVVLANNGFVRLVPVLLVVNHMLLFNLRITIFCILTLIGRQWSSGRRVAGLPLVPTMPFL